MRFSSCRFDFTILNGYLPKLEIVLRHTPCRKRPKSNTFVFSCNKAAVENVVHQDCDRDGIQDMLFVCLSEKYGIVLVSHNPEKTRRTADRDCRTANQARPEEQKWQAARRRFLSGGAAALPVIVSVTSARAAQMLRVSTLQRCASLGGTEGDEGKGPSGSIPCNIP